MRLTAGALALYSTVLAVAGAASAAASFIDATEATGIQFRHTGGGWDPYFPEMMGSGACWLDADDDGYEDLFLGNGKYNDSARQERERPTGKFFLSNGDGTFRDATAGSGLDFEGYGLACSVADWNGDACLDLYVAGYDLSRLFRGGCDGTFKDATASAGVRNDICPEYLCFAHSSGWADVDLDRDLDLLIANYVALNHTEVWENSPGPYRGQPNALYRNNGDGTFTEAGAATNLTGIFNHREGKSLGIAWQDYDLDGDADVYVANDETPAFLYRNDGGVFKDIAPQEGVNYTRAGMGVTWGDWDNNGCPDLIATHFATEWDGFVRNYCNGDLADESGDLHGINARFETDVRWGVGFIDYDNDGWKDIYIVSGGVYYDNDTVAWIPPAQPPTIYHNEMGNGGTPTSFSNASALGETFRRNARGAAFADFDFDGNVDVVTVANNNETALVVRGTGAPGNWLEVQLRDPGAADPFAFGARVDVKVGSVTQHRQMFPSWSFESSNSLTLHFGLGAATVADQIRVTWPGGVVETWSAVNANAVVRLTRGGGIATDTLSPLTTIVPKGVSSPDGQWRGAGAGFEITAADRAVGAPSGVVERWYRVDGGPATAYTGFVALSDGTHAIEAWSVDAAGNRSPVARETIRVDATLPTIEASVTGAPAASGWRLAVPTVTFTAADVGSGVARIEMRDGAGPWLTYDAPFPALDGVHAYEARAIDVAGQSSAVIVLDVRVDALPPEVSLHVDALAGGSGWWRSTATVTPRATDATSGIVTIERAIDGGPLVAGSAPFTLAEGRHVVRVRAADRAGHVVDVPLDVNVDATAPATVATFDATPGDAGWSRGVRASLAASDATSGVLRTTVKFNDGPETTVTGPVPLPEGDVTVTWRATDVAGNVEPARSESKRVDSVPPTTTVALAGTRGENGWWRSPVTATLAASDATSGVRATRAALGSAPLALHEGGPLTLAAEGENALAFLSEDVAGNAEAARSVVARVDTLPPVAAFALDALALDNGWIGDVRVRIAVTDAASGVALTELLADGVPIAPGTALPEGAHALTLRAVDRAGNEAPQVAQAIRIDEHPPRTDLVVASGASHRTPSALYLAPDAEVALPATDSASGVAVTWISIDGAAPAAYAGPLAFSPGAHTLAYWSEDVAGREEARREVAIVVDATAPALALVSPSPSAVGVGAQSVAAPAGELPLAVAVSDAIAVEASASDTESGVARVLVLVDGELVATLAGDAGDYAWTWRPAITDAGLRTITVVAIDHVGNAASASRDVLVVPAPVGVLRVA